MKKLQTLLHWGVFCAGLLASCPALADAREEACQQATLQVIADPAAACLAVCAQAARIDKFDYHGSLSAAMSSRGGLEKFAQYIEHSKVDATAQGEEACHLFALLVKWGDGSFSAAVAHAGPKAKDRISALLDSNSLDDFKARFPQTYGLSSQHN